LERTAFPHGKANKALSGRQEVLLVSPFREFNTAGLNTEREAKLRGHRTEKVSKHNGQQLRRIHDLTGAGSRIRTDDLLITNQLLYQLSYAGKNAPHINAHRRLEQVAKVISVNAS
jgi:hypothetical protein